MLYMASALNSMLSSPKVKVKVRTLTALYVGSLLHFRIILN